MALLCCATTQLSNIFMKEAPLNSPKPPSPVPPIPLWPLVPKLSVLKYPSQSACYPSFSAVALVRGSRSSVRRRAFRVRPGQFLYYFLWSPNNWSPCHILFRGEAAGRGGCDRRCDVWCGPQLRRTWFRASVFPPTKNGNVAIEYAVCRLRTLYKTLVNTQCRNSPDRKSVV